jgi:hypothetical protein
VCRRRTAPRPQTATAEQTHRPATTSHTQQEATSGQGEGLNITPISIGETLLPLDHSQSRPYILPLPISHTCKLHLYMSLCCIPVRVCRAATGGTWAAGGRGRGRQSYSTTARSRRNATTATPPPHCPCTCHARAPHRRACCGHTCETRGGGTESSGGGEQGRGGNGVGLCAYALTGAGVSFSVYGRVTSPPNT